MSLYTRSERELLILIMKESIKIIPYEAKYRKAFRDLNKEWIDAYFVMEEEDYKALDNPNASILDKGGEILVALYEDEVAGVCALVRAKNDRFDYELAKMAVSPKFHGKGIGYAIGKAVIDRAKELGGKSIFLESNTILTPAISLYRKLGFTEVKGVSSPYERSNIIMEMSL